MSGAMHGDCLHAFLSRNHCRPLSESVARDTLPTVRAVRDHEVTHLASVCVRFVIHRVCRGGEKVGERARFCGRV